MNAAASKEQDKNPEGNRKYKVTVKTTKLVNHDRTADWIQVTDGGALIGWVEDYDNSSKVAWAYGVGAWFNVTRV